ncbi:hypothetical protein SAMN03159423_5738 [Bradyrhizobium sp. NFR13]|nr:hypothetical protein SAMN03159423_5738 [Bradyrhizobium sp. NFR13]
MTWPAGYKTTVNESETITAAQAIDRCFKADRFLRLIEPIERS